MTKTMLLYKDIQVLSREAHRNLKVKAVDNAGFASQIHLSPIAGSEFYSVALNYPIVFIKTDPANPDSQIVPLALLGLEPDANEFVDKDNNWELGLYVPAFVRRYPFVLANAFDDDEGSTVCFDNDYKGFNEDEGEVLFDNDGNPSPFLSDVIQFMGGFKTEMQRTSEFVKLLEKHELLEVKSANINSASGESFQVQDFLVIDEQKFNELASFKVNEFHKNGFLGWVFAHLISLGNLPPLFDRHLARKEKAKTKVKSSSKKTK